MPSAAKVLIASCGQAAGVRACAVAICLAVLWRLTNNLGANPAEYLIRSTGDWTLRFLCMTLAVTPHASSSGTRAGALSAHAGVVCLLLCHAAPAELQLVRHGF
jgi:sulfoxide reductase heme-binding subunit YedZ